MKRSETACFTGHRTLASKDRSIIEHKLREMIESLIYQGFENFLCGGAIGFDTLAGFAVMDLRRQYPHIKLLLVLPCHGQDSKWNDEQKALYRDLLFGADDIRYITDHYSATCMLQRNRHMVDHSLHCIAYLKRPYGGTFQTVRFAREQNLVVHNLAEA